MGNQSGREVRTVIYHRDKRIICCVDGVCEEFECEYGMFYDHSTLDCGEKILKNFKTKRNNDIPLAKP